MALLWGGAGGGGACAFAAHALCMKNLTIDLQAEALLSNGLRDHS